MSEQGQTRGDKRHPIVALLLDNPISALNAAMILVGGGMVWSTNEARMRDIEKQVARVEESYKQADRDQREAMAETRGRLEAGEGRNAQKIEAMSAQMSTVSVKISGIETSLRFLVDQQRRRPND